MLVPSPHTWNRAQPACLEAARQNERMATESRALLIVDVQPTFCEGGALGVEGGTAVAEAVAEYVAQNRDFYTLIATTQDWHIDPGEHFATPPAEPDYVNTWPPHGVAGTAEAELHPALADVNADVTIKKGQYDHGYSGFDGTTESGETLADALKNAGITSVDVVGLVESHCVRATALDALKLGMKARVLSDLTVPVSEEQGVAAREEMAAAGVEALNSADA